MRGLISGWLDEDNDLHDDEMGEKMSVAEFLEARVAEDEADARRHFCEPGFEIRILAECTAKRAIIAYSPPKTLQHLAAVYADHPDYRKEWAL